jgi:hypothetical protein
MTANMENNMFKIKQKCFPWQELPSFFSAIHLMEKHAYEKNVENKQCLKGFANNLQ